MELCLPCKSGMLDVGMEDGDQAVDLLAVDQLWDSGTHTTQTNDD